MAGRLHTGGADDATVAAVHGYLSSLPGYPADQAVFAAQGELRLTHALPGAAQPDLAAFGAPARVGPLLTWLRRHPPHVVVVTDRIGADLTAVPRGAVAGLERTVVGPDDEVERNAPGGWSQPRYQRRAEDAWQHNAGAARPDGRRGDPRRSAHPSRGTRPDAHPGCERDWWHCRGVPLLSGLRRRFIALIPRPMKTCERPWSWTTMTDTATKTLELLGKVREGMTARSVVAEPITQDGLTVISVARISGGGGGGGGTGPGTAGDEGSGTGAGFGMSSRPVGAFVIKDGTVRWRPAIDVNRIILGGQIVAVGALLTIHAVVKARR
ncbi:spore germination protein GerW family protein [Actinomycetes bacterium KLBMP 9797]